MILKKYFWKSDWFAGLIIPFIFLLAGGSTMLQSLERNAYDVGLLFSNSDPDIKKAVIVIDDHSLAITGRFPCSRDVQAKIIDLPKQAKDKVIANAVIYAEP